MKKKIILALVIIISLSFTQFSSASDPNIVIPTFEITAVDAGNSVSIKAKNFIPADNYTVTMGAYGTRGVGGTVVTIQNAGTGTFTATYDIPAALKDQIKIAIRLQSPTTGYYSYNWFWNNDYPSGGDPSEPVVTTGWGYPLNGPGTIPQTTITENTAGADVTVTGKNFTTKDTYTIYIGKFGTKGVGGIKVATLDTNNTGTFTETFLIPDTLKDENKLAIRFVSPATGYYAYDWFVNQPASTPITPSSEIGYPPNGKNTIPYVKFTVVTKDDSVEINGYNFTTNDTYNVYMGVFGTKAVGGIMVGTQATSATGTFTATFDIPASLIGDELIAIRLVSPATGYYAYDFFANE